MTCWVGPPSKKHILKGISSGRPSFSSDTFQGFPLQLCAILAEGNVSACVSWKSPPTVPGTELVPGTEALMAPASGSSSVLAWKRPVHDQTYLTMGKSLHARHEGRVSIFIQNSGWEHWRVQQVTQLAGEEMSLRRHSLSIVCLLDRMMIH